MVVNVTGKLNCSDCQIVCYDLTSRGRAKEAKRAVKKRPTH